jgi:3-dehydroquinate synthase
VPWAVINDAKLLCTLPDRDFRCGFSEAVKVSLLKSEAEFSWLCENSDAIREREAVATKRAVHQSCLLHLKHITHGGDPFEMLEARPLDFGHWSAHRLEPLTGYQIRHGEAVAIGVAIDTIYSSLKFGFPEQDMRAVCKCLTRLGIPLWHEELTPTERLMQGLEEFRQHLGGRLTITMLRGVGDPIDVHEIDHATMRNAIEQLQTIQQELAVSHEPKVGSEG